MSVTADGLVLQTVLITMLIFGFAPGVTLRVIIRAWPHDHPRRRELMAELKAVPYVERLLWVAEQVESAIFDGLPTRYRSRGELFRSRQSVAALVGVVGLHCVLPVVAGAASLSIATRKEINVPLALLACTAIGATRHLTKRYVNPAIGPGAYLFLPGIVSALCWLAAVAVGSVAWLVADTTLLLAWGSVVSMAVGPIGVPLYITGSILSFRRYPLIGRVLTLLRGQ